MSWTELHGRLMAEAFKRVLGRPETGAMAFARCLPSEIVEALAGDLQCFALEGWRVYHVADTEDADRCAITADRAVELREKATEPVLLLADSSRAGAGMDGIYSATREISEASLFQEASRGALRVITRRLSAKQRKYAEKAVKTAQGHGRRNSVSPWQAFDFYVRAAAEQRHPGSFLYLLGLWPEDGTQDDGLDLALRFVTRLVGPEAASRTPRQRIAALKLSNPTDSQLADLERFLRRAASTSFLMAMSELADNRQLWIGSLRLETSDQQVRRITLEPWRNPRSGKIAAWTGLKTAENADEPPRLVRVCQKSG